MPTPSLITDLSQTAGSNYPAGSDSPSVLDDVQRAHAGFIAQLRDGKGQSTPLTLASATTTDIGGQNSQFVEISGTTTITSLGTNYTGIRYLRFTGALTLTHNATSLNINGGASIVTVAGDTATAIPNTALNGWNVFYVRNSAAPGGADYLNTLRIDVASATTTDLTANAPNTRHINIIGTTAITAFTIASGQTYFVRFNASLVLTNNSSIVTQTGGSITTAAGDTCILRSTAANVVEVLSYVSAVGSLLVRSYLSGLTLSTAGSSTTMTASAGVAMDSTNAFLMQLTSAYNKTTSAWAVGSGNGGLDTGSISNSTWYHWFLIRRPDTNVIEVLCSLSATAPTLPTNYTQYRRIGSGRTNGSGQWTKFVQDGDSFQWDVAVLDVDVTTPTTSAVTRTLSVPTGVRVRANFNYGAYDLINANQIGAYFSDLSITDTAPSTTAAPLITSQSSASNNTAGYNNISVWTNTSAQIRSRMTVSSATSVLKMATLGWVDSRGRDA